MTTTNAGQAWHTVATVRSILAVPSPARCRTRESSPSRRARRAGLVVAALTGMD
jgi:hypothetical protein